MTRAFPVPFLLLLTLAQMLAAQTQLPSGASFDIGFSPGGSSLAVVEKAIASAKTGDSDGLL